VMQAVTSWLQMLNTNFLYVMMQALLLWWGRFLVVTVQVSLVYLLLHLCHIYVAVRIKLLASEYLLFYFLKCLCILLVCSDCMSVQDYV
jgi:hypothetical protein